MSKLARFKALTAVLLVFLTVGMLPAQGVSADGGPVVTPLGDPAATIYGGVRFRSFASNIQTLEVFQGSDLNPPSPPGSLVTQNLTWIRPGMNSITFTYDDAAHTLTSVVNDNPALVFSNFVPAGPVNYMRIVVVERDLGSKVDFKHVALDGYGLGNFGTKTPKPQDGCFTLTPGDPANSWCSWKVTGYDMSQGFTLTGDIKLLGAFSAVPEASKVEIVVGNLP